MKNEEKIIELLAEYIQKADIHNERFEKALEVLIMHSEELMELRKKSENHDDELLEIKKQKIDYDKELLEIKKDIKKQETKNEVILQEIFKLSKRVNNLEE